MQPPLMARFAGDVHDPTWTRPALDATQLPAGAPASESGGVKAFVRLRPPAQESDIEIFEFPQERPGMVTIKDPLSAGRSEHTFEFNGVFPREQSQEKLFAPVANPIVDAALKGSSGCILAYGQTGSGKTYSIFGEGGSGRSRGLLPRAVEKLFERLPEFDRTCKDPGQGASPGLAVSFLEIYMDRVRDLAQDAVEDNDITRSRAGSPPRPQASSSRPSSVGCARRGRSGGPGAGDRDGLEIREGPAGTVHVRGLTRLPVQDFTEVQRIIDLGLSRRATAKTAVNTHSSRSHTVFTVYITKQADPKALANDEYDDFLENSIALSFVDLAGSERLAKSKAEGARFQEAVSINSSLTALGKVVLALASDSRKHVPYRDSKLTRILSQSFSGGAKVALLATVHPRVEDYEESLNTLSFADRCKNVSTQPQVVYISAKKSSQMRIADLQSQIAQLKDELKQQQAANAAQLQEQMNNCGVRAIGGFGKPVDDIDMEIAKAIINADGKGSEKAGRSNSHTSQGEQQETTVLSAAAAGGARPPSGSRSRSHQRKTATKNIWQEVERRERRERTARERGVAALVELQEERGRQADAHEKAEQRMMMLEKEKESLAELEEQRSGCTTELEKRNGELEEALGKAQEQVKQMLEEHGEKHDQALQELQESTEKQLQQADMALLRAPTNLHKMQGIAQAKNAEWQERSKKTETQQLDRARGMKKDQDGELGHMKSQLQAQIDTQEESNERLTKELAELRERQERAVSHCQAELLSLYEQIVKLSKLAADIEDGKHPVVRRAGLREVVLPDGACPSMPSSETHPHLFEAIAADDEKAPSSERSGQRHSSSGRWRRVGAGGFAAVSAAVALRNSASESSRGRPSAEGEVVALDVGLANTRGRNAAQGARSLCEVDDDSEAHRLLATLSVDNLRSLCLELRDCSLEVFAPGEEREALRRIGLAGLEDVAMSQYLQELGQRRCSERTALGDTVERSLQLRSFICSRRSSATTSQQGTSRLASRSLSRPMTPVGGRSRPSSRSSSRPGTASNSRPPPPLPATVAAATAAF